MSDFLKKLKETVLMTGITLDRNPGAKAVAQLVTRIKAKDDESIKILVDWCKDRVLLKVQNELSRFPSLWEDVLWEIIEALISSIQNGIFERSGVTLAAYVFGIVKNKIHDTRKNELKNRLDGKSTGTIETKQISSPIATMYDFVGLNKRTNQMESVLRICLKHLRKNHHQHAKAIEMFYLEDLSLKDVASRMGVTVQKVTDLKAYGLKKLYRCLDGYRD